MLPYFLRNINLASKNSAIAIALVLDLCFFITAVVISFISGHDPLALKVWETFAATNLLLVGFLNSDSGKHTPPPPAVSGS